MKIHGKTILHNPTKALPYQGFVTYSDGRWFATKHIQHVLSLTYEDCKLQLDKLADRIAKDEWTVVGG